MMPFTCPYPSPVGELRLVAFNHALTAVLWPHQPAPTDVAPRADHPLLKLAAQQLNEYFAGQRRQFSIPLDPVGTPFQQSVWKQLQQIPHGQTKTYGAIARALRQPTASRAVGGANNRNPLPIFIPCHRVIAANGDLTGFEGGLSAKRFLLTLEQDHAFQLCA